MCTGARVYTRENFYSKIVKNRIKRYSILCILTALSIGSFAAGRGDMYLCDFGFQGGIGYYVGDANPHIFAHPREAYGGFFRYRFTQRWALQVQGITQRITGLNPDGTGFAVKNNGMWSNQLANIDVVAEYNFFRFDVTEYDSRVKTYTPYIGLGIGMSIHSGFTRVSGYLPFVIGFKWKFHPRCNLQIVWQHNVYFSDNLEHVDAYNNLHDLNGSNILNCDVTGTLMVGLSVAFATGKKVCRRCEE